MNRLMEGIVTKSSVIVGRVYEKDHLTIHALLWVVTVVVNDPDKPVIELKGSQYIGDLVEQEINGKTCFLWTAKDEYCQKNLRYPKEGFEYLLDALHWFEEQNVFREEV